MKNIKVKLSPKSVGKAIEQLEKLKATIKSGNVIKDFLFGCCEKIIELANRNLESYDIGVNVKDKIFSSWTYENSFAENRVVLKNTCDKAVYIEFGVGVVGQRNSHELADREGYEYNIPTLSKYAGNYHDENTWRFYKNSIEDVDLRNGFYEVWQTQNGEFKIITQGSPATMFVFKAVQEFKAQNLANEVWLATAKKYWG